MAAPELRDSDSLERLIPAPSGVWRALEARRVPR